jgi:hypothetical protein
MRARVLPGLEGAVVSNRTHTSPTSLDVCAGCTRPFVVPDTVLDVLDDGRFLVELRCTNCGLVIVGAHDEAALEDLDRRLDAVTGDLQASLGVLDLVDELERIDRFAAALAADAILPEDF